MYFQAGNAASKLIPIGSAGAVGYTVADFFGGIGLPDVFQSKYDEFAEWTTDLFSTNQNRYNAKGNSESEVRTKTFKGRESKYGRNARITPEDEPEVATTPFENISQFSEMAREHSADIEKLALVTAAISPKTASIGAGILLLNDIVGGVYSSRSSEAEPSSLIDKLSPILTILAVGKISEQI